jgi:hypothetical protein
MTFDPVMLGLTAGINAIAINLAKVSIAECDAAIGGKYADGAKNFAGRNAIGDRVRLTIDRHSRCVAQLSRIAINSQIKFRNTKKGALVMRLF